MSEHDRTTCQASHQCHLPFSQQLTIFANMVSLLVNSFSLAVLIPYVPWPQWDCIIHVEDATRFRGGQTLVIHLYSLLGVLSRGLLPSFLLPLVLGLHHFFFSKPIMRCSSSITGSRSIYLATPLKLLCYVTAPHLSILTLTTFIKSIQM